MAPFFFLILSTLARYSASIFTFIIYPITCTRISNRIKKRPFV